MNHIFISGRLTETPRILGSGESQWGLIKFWHKDGESKDGTPNVSYRSAYCSFKTVQYLLERGWGQGDEVYVSGPEKIELNEKDGKTYTNVTIYNAKVSCGLKKGDTLKKSGNVSTASAPTPAPQSPEEPRSMAELAESFDEEEMIID